MATATKTKKTKAEKIAPEAIAAAREHIIGNLHQDLLSTGKWQAVLDCDDEWEAASVLRDTLIGHYARPAMANSPGVSAENHGLVVTLRLPVPGTNRGEDRAVGAIEWHEAAEALLKLAMTDDPPDLRNTTLPSGIAARDPDAEKPSAISDQPSAKKLSADSFSAERSSSIQLDDIRPSPFQTRREFAAEELEQLAASLEEHGLLQPIVVREVAIDDPRAAAATYELIAGERRWRAARLAGWQQISVRIIECDDDRAAELVAVENLQRADLNPIEEAEALQQLLARGGTQAELGQRIGRSQSYIANAVRLLSLPEPWRGRVISREMSPSHAKLLAPHLERPKVLAALNRDWPDKPGEGPSLRDWERDVNAAIRAATVPLVKSVHNADYQYGEVKLDAKKHADLDAVELETWGGRKEARAFNGTLAKKLLAEKEEAWQKKHPAKKSSGKAEKGSAAAKAKADMEASRRQSDLEEWAACWQSRLIADAIEAGITEGEWSRLLLWAFAEGTYSEALQEACEAVAQSLGTTSAWKAKDAGTVLVKALVGIFRDCGPGDKPPVADGADLDSICSLLSITPDKYWLDRPGGKQRFAGELTEALWELYTVEQLIDQAAVWKIASDLTGRKHAEIVTIIQAQSKPLPLPAEIAALLPKAKKAKRGAR
ncbi:MAG: ParB/RepB/Spo0J family partition protein [Pirellulales bacterium]